MVTITSALALVIPREGFGRFILLVGIVLLFVAVLAATRRWAGAAAIALGVIGVSVGIARGLRFVSAEEADPVAWLALIAGAAGIVLVVIGFAHLVSGWRWWAKALTGVTAALAAAFGIFTLSIPLAATDPPRARVISQAPPGWNDISFPAQDGTTLSGWLHPGSNSAAVVVVPGSGSSRSGALQQAQVLADNGFGVLVYDPRGHGNSDGTAMDLGWAGDQDVSGAVDYLVGTGVRNVGALGLSMGGEQVIGAAAADPRIAAIAAEGATHRTASDYAWLSDEFGWRGSVQEALNVPRFALTDLLAEQTPPTKLAAAARTINPRPMLLMAAGTVQDEGLATAFIADGTDAQVWVIADAGHIGGLTTAPDQWTERVVDFFTETLDP
jgi:pimeloyl-ACP methyl ester carboxylesterase